MPGDKLLSQDVNIVKGASCELLIFLIYLYNI